MPIEVQLPAAWYDSNYRQTALTVLSIIFISNYGNVSS